MLADTKESVKMKKFSKLKFLEIMGFLNDHFNQETLQFERSFSVRLRTFLIVFFKVVMPLKFFVSLFFPKESAAQLYVGNMFNYLPGKTRARTV